MNNEENERIYQDRAMKKLKLLKTKRINLIDKVELITKVIVPSLRYTGGGRNCETKLIKCFLLRKSLIKIFVCFSLKETTQL